MSVAKEILKGNERSLLDYWVGLRAGHARLEQSDAVPEDLFPWIGNLHLLKPIGGGRDFRYVIFTTRTLIGADQDMTGKRVSHRADKQLPRHLAGVSPAPRRRDALNDIVTEPCRPQIGYF